jgi:hypothetical protein
LPGTAKRRGGFLQTFSNRIMISSELKPSFKNEFFGTAESRPSKRVFLRARSQRGTAGNLRMRRLHQLLVSRRFGQVRKLWIGANLICSVAGLHSLAQPLDGK